MVVTNLERSGIFKVAFKSEGGFKFFVDLFLYKLSSGYFLVLYRLLSLVKYSLSSSSRIILMSLLCFLEFLLDSSLMALLTRCSRVSNCDSIFDKPFSAAITSDDLLARFGGDSPVILAADFQLCIVGDSILGTSPRYLVEKVTGL